MISQLSVFLSNEQGRLASACRTLADASVNLSALYIADTSTFGIVRMFCNDPERAVAVLKEAGFRAELTPVVAVRVPNEPGGLARLLELCDREGLNIEYSYCFLVGSGSAIDVLKIDNEQAEALFERDGFTLVSAEEIYGL